jgi:hypothetical protein
MGRSWRVIGRTERMHGKETLWAGSQTLKNGGTVVNVTIGGTLSLSIMSRICEFNFDGL